MTSPSKESVELLDCPFCGRQPVWLGNAFVCSQTLCPNQSPFSLDEWQTRPSPWKPVDDRARDGQEWLLLFWGGQVSSGSWVQSDTWKGWSCPDRLFEADQVTHYMPLPKLPGGAK